MDLISAPPRGMSRRDVLRVVFRRKAVVLALLISIVATAAAKTFLGAPVYRASCTLLIQQDQPRSIVLGSGLSLVQQVQAKSEAGIIRSPLVLKAAAKAARLPEPEADQLATRLQMKTQEDAGLIEVAYESTDPQRAADVVHAVVEQYLAARPEVYRDVDEYDFLNRQLEVTLKRLSRLEQQSEARSGEVAPDQQEVLLMEQVKAFQTALNHAETQLIRKRTELKTLESQIRNGGYRTVGSPSQSGAVGRWRLVGALQDRLLSLELERDALRQRYAAEDPVVARLEEQIRHTDEKLRTEAQEILDAERAGLAALEEEETVLRTRVASLTRALSAASRDRTAHDRIARDLEDNAEIYSMLLHRREEARIDRQSLVDMPNVRVVSPATVPSKPVRPRKVRDMTLASLLGLFVALSAAFVLEYVDHAIRTPEDVERYLGLPLLGSVPDVHYPPSERQQLRGAA